MRILDRFTRDRASRYLWGGFTIVFLFGIVWAGRSQRDALQQAKDDAEARAVHYVQTTLFENLNSDLVNGPILAQNYRALIVPVTAEIFTDPAVSRVRIWNPEGGLIFSTSERDLIGQATASNSPGIDHALQGEVTTTPTDATVAPRQGLEGSTERLLQTFVPLRVPDRLSIVGVAEIDQKNAVIVAGTDQPWRNFEIFFAIGVAVCALFALLSLRKAHATIGSGVELPLPAAEEREPTSPAEISRELKEAKDQLRQAVEAATFLEGKLKEARAASAAPAADDPRVGDLEQQLQAALAELSTAREQMEAPSAASRVKELEEQLRAEQLGRAQAEIASRDAGLAAASEIQRSNELQQALDAARSQMPTGTPPPMEAASTAAAELMAIQEELDGARAQADASKFETQAARAEVERARARLAEAEATIAQMASERGAPSGAPGFDPQALAELEERVAEAEERAQAAERHLEELAEEHEEETQAVDPVAAQALRERLARTAAAKRLVTHDENEGNGAS